MTTEYLDPGIRSFFETPQPLVHPRTLVISACVVFVGVLSAVSDGGGGSLVLAGLGTLYGLTFPVRSRYRSGDDVNEVQYVSLLRYPGARERYHARPSPDEVLARLMAAIGQVRDGSRARLGLDETTRDPICVVGPLYSESVDGVAPELVLRRRTPSGYVYSTYRITVFHFSEAFLAAYQCNFSLIENRVTAEETAEFFYRDVVAVRTLTESSGHLLKNGERLERSQTFSLTVASGDRIRVVIDDPAIQIGAQLRSLSDEAAANVRAMLRQYKAPLQDAS